MPAFVGPLLQLVLVLENIHLVHFAHFLDFVEVNHEASSIGVGVLHALPAEHFLVVGAIKVADALVVLEALQALEAAVVIKVQVFQNSISFNYFMKNIEVERELVNAFQVLHEFAADGAPYAVVVMQH